MFVFISIATSSSRSLVYNRDVPASRVYSSFIIQSTVVAASI